MCVKWGVRCRLFVSYRGIPNGSIGGRQIDDHGLRRVGRRARSPARTRVLRECDCGLRRCEGVSRGTKRAAGPVPARRRVNLMT